MRFDGNAKKHLKFPAGATIIKEQRVAFLRKSGCRNATRVFYGMGRRKIHNSIR